MTRFLSALDRKIARTLTDWRRGGHHFRRVGGRVPVTARLRALREVRRLYRGDSS